MNTKRYVVVMLVVIAVATGWWLYTTLSDRDERLLDSWEADLEQRAEERAATATAVEAGTATAEARATVVAGTPLREPRATVVSRTQRREPSATERKSADRWREAEVHWEALDAFTESMTAVNADRVIDLAESRDLCYKAPQWREQLDGVLEYVVEYRAVEPGLVTRTPRLHNLEIEAERALVVVSGLEEEC